MADIQKIIDNLNIPKQILDKSEALLKALFGESFTELGGMIADQVRLRRFKNQISIFSKAQKILKERNISPEKVSLKVLVPLLEFSSYEEDAVLQEKWSALTAHILQGDSDLLFQQNCISILNKISSEEAFILDSLLSIIGLENKRRYNDRIELYKSLKIDEPVEKKIYVLDSFKFNVDELHTNAKISKNEYAFKVSNLVSLGLLNWLRSEETVQTERVFNGDVSFVNEIELTIYSSESFCFTPFGYKLVTTCRSK